MGVANFLENMHSLVDKKMRNNVFTVPGPLLAHAHCGCDSGFFFIKSQEMREMGGKILMMQFKCNYLHGEAHFIKKVLLVRYGPDALRQ